MAMTIFKYSMDAVCANCGKIYGRHYGEFAYCRQRSKKDVFKPLPVEKTEKTEKTNEGLKPGDIISVLNEKDALPFINKTVLYCDNEHYRRDPNPWKKGTLVRFTDEDCDYPFRVRLEMDSECSVFHMIKLIDESFISVDPDLIKALKKSIAQWQIMYDTGKSKQEVYNSPLDNSDKDPISDLNCFLCDYVGIAGMGGNSTVCKKCINWGDNADFCHDGKTVYTDWQYSNKSQATLKKVLDHLKSELVRLETLA